MDIKFETRCHSRALSSVTIAILVVILLTASAAASADEPAFDVTPPPGSTPSPSDEGGSDEKTYTNVRESEISRDPSGHGFALFGGLGLGYGSLSADLPESKKNGLLFNARAVGTYVDRKVIYDVGLIWLYSKMSGEDLISKINVLTQAAVLELSPRYRLSDHIDIGPIGQFLFGTDTSFGEDGSEAGTHVFVGLKAMYSEFTTDFHWRLGIQATTDLTIQKRQVWLPMLVAEIGIPFSRNKTILRERETVRVRKVVETKIVREGDKFTFDDEIVHFEVGRSDLFPESREFFLQLGQFLATNPDVYQNIKISGHTDSTGTPENNRLLSQDRAKAVASVLTEGGVPADRVESEGSGQDVPIDSNDTEIGRARNRRVELSFGEGANATRIHEEIKKIKVRTVKPRTCEGDVCR